MEETKQTVIGHQSSISRKNNRKAWMYFYPEGNGKAKKGYNLHHKDQSLKGTDIERYIQWNVEDLEMVTTSEHNLIHKKHETMRKNSDEAHKDAHHYFNKTTHEQKMFKEDPGCDWERGLNFRNDRRSILAMHQLRDKNGMFMKSAYDGKTDKELETIRDKKQSTFYARPQEDRDLINGRRGHGTPVVCITTGDWFRSPTAASRAYKEFGCSKIHNVYKGECYAGMKNGERLRWRLATKEENDMHKDEFR